MFRLVRFFLATGAIVAAAIVLAFYLYRQSEVERLIELAERQNVELARSFANTIWPRFSSLLMPSSGPDEDDPLTDPRIRELTEAVKTVTAGLPVLKVKIYTLDGRTAYSSNLVEIGERCSAARSADDHGAKDQESRQRGSEPNDGKSACCAKTGGHIR